MSTLKTTLVGGAAAALLTSLPVAWQGIELHRLRAAAVSPPAAAYQKQTVVQHTSPSPGPGSAEQTNRNGSRPAGTSPAPLDLAAIAKAVESSMQGLVREAAGQMALVESRRTALALGLTAEAEAALRRRLVDIWESVFQSDEGTSPDRESGENFQQRTRRFIEEHLSATATPEQIATWPTLRRQREETEIEKVAADAFHATARLVDLTAEQKDALFRKFSEQARELYATNWENSFSAGAAIVPRPPEPLENDESLLRDILTPEQISDWQSQSAMQRDFYDRLPHRVMSRVFSVVTGNQLADAIRNDLPDAAGSVPPSANSAAPQ